MDHPTAHMLLRRSRKTYDLYQAEVKGYEAPAIYKRLQKVCSGLPPPPPPPPPPTPIPVSAETAEPKASNKRKDEKMKIAWRYERLGEFGAGVAGSRDGE